MRITLTKESALPRHKINFSDNGCEVTDISYIHAAKKGIMSALSYLGIKTPCELELCFTDEEGIITLNKQFRDMQRVTDVLSFPSMYLRKGENPDTTADSADYINGRIFIGSIVICKAVAQNQALQYGHRPEREYAFLAVHSVLHLLGYDHVLSAEEETEMFTLQEKILRSAGFSR